MQLNLSNCTPTVTVIFRYFFGIRYCINRILDIGVRLPSKFPINLQNEFQSKMEKGVYASAHRIIVLS